MSEENELLQEIRTAQQLGFVTSLNGAGYDSAKIEDLYGKYTEQRTAREETLSKAYDAITGN